MKFNRNTFFQYARRAPFGGKLSTQQVEGLEKILKYAEQESGWTDVRWIAYLLATVFLETAHTMQPIEEIGKGKGREYGPTGYWGRGLIQLTWEANYKKYGIEKTPERALEWPTALHIAFDGMEKGVFTGKRLSMYFNKKANDPVGARKIINGTDKAKLIASYYEQFKGALDAADTKTPQPEDVNRNAKVPDDVKPSKSGWLKTLITSISGSGLFGMVTNLDNIYAVGGIAVLTLGVVGLIVYLVRGGYVSFNDVSEKDIPISGGTSGPLPSVQSEDSSSEEGREEGDSGEGEKRE